jgi:hypothetical protein
VIFRIENVNHVSTRIFIIFISDFFCESSNTIPRQYHSIVFNCNLYGKLTFVPVFMLFLQLFIYNNKVNHFFTRIFIIFISDFFCESLNTIPRQYHSIVFNCDLYGKLSFVPVFILFYSYLYIIVK